MKIPNTIANKNWRSLKTENGAKSKIRFKE